MTREAHTDEARTPGLLPLVDLDDLCANRLFSDGARGTLAQQASFLITEVRRLASRLATITPEREAVRDMIADAWAAGVEHGCTVTDQEWLHAEAFKYADNCLALFNTGKAEAL